MKKILYSLLAVIVVLAISPSAMAVETIYPKDIVSVPYDQQNRYPVDPDYYVSDYVYISSAAEVLVCTGECILDAIVLSSGAPSSYMIVRDTGTADASGDQVLPYLFFPSTNTANPIYAPLDGQKMKFEDGISVTLSSYANGERAVVYFTDLK